MSFEDQPGCQPVESEALVLLRLLESAADAIVLVEPDQTIRLANQEAVRLFGYNREQLIGQKLERLIPNTVREAHADDFRAFFQEWRIRRMGEGRELLALRADGTHIPVEIGLTPIELGLTRLVMATVRDVTARRESDQLLSQSRDLYSTTFNEAPVGIAHVSMERRWSLVNRRLWEILDSSPEFLIGRLYDDMIHPEDLPSCHEAMERILSGSCRSERAQKRYVLRDGREVLTNTSLSIHSDSEGQPLNWIVVLEDITSLQIAEAELREANTRLQEALGDLRKAQSRIVEQERLRALGTMASGIAHDFNNALSPVLGYADLMLSNPDRVVREPERTLRFLRHIHTAAKDASTIVGRLHEFYRHRESGEVFLPVDLNQLVEQVIDLTRPRWKDQAEAASRTIRVTAKLDPVPKVAANEHELREVLTNLIFNAIDALPSGGDLVFRTMVDPNPSRLVRSPAPGQETGEPAGDQAGNERFVALSLEDTGTGMTEEVRRRCLEPFFTTKQAHGTGLGLAMAHGILRRHEGSLEIESEWGEGTKVTMRLPVYPEAQQVIAPVSLEPGFPRRLNVLVVDDQPGILEIIREFLIEDGHHVEIAGTGRMALRLIRQSPFDLVCIDRAMPQMSGDQLALLLHQLVPDLPVVMITGFGQLMDATGELPPGVDLVIPKPVTQQTLRTAIARVLGVMT